MSSSEITCPNVPNPSNGGLLLGDDARHYLDNQIAKDWPDLELWERAFAHQYVTNGGNHREAAKYINRAVSSGLSITRRPLLRAFIKHLQDEQYDVSLITPAFIEANYMYIAECARGDEKVNMVDSEGTEFSAKKYDGQLLLAVNKEMGNHIGYTKVEKSTDSKVTVIVDMGALTGRAPVTIKAEDGEIIDE